MYNKAPKLSLAHTEWRLNPSPSSCLVRYQEPPTLSSGSLYSATSPHPTDSPSEEGSNQGEPFLPSIRSCIQQTFIKPRRCRPCGGHGDGEGQVPVLRELTLQWGKRLQTARSQYRQQREVVLGQKQELKASLPIPQDPGPLAPERRVGAGRANTAGPNLLPLSPLARSSGPEGPDLTPTHRRSARSAQAFPPAPLPARDGPPRA